MREINFDGLVGPSHNYAGLSFGNLASMGNAGAVSCPRTAALQGLAKMRAMLDMGLPQGILLPHPRPDIAWLRGLGFAGDDTSVCETAYAQEPALLGAALSASAMWTANAATVSPAPDTHDARCHFTVANLSSMLHRSIEHDQTHAQLALAFANTKHFAVHRAITPALGDEGAANHMRMCAKHGTQAIEIFVYGEKGGAFPSRQHRAASGAVARRHGLSQALFVAQSEAAIAAGAFHNDVVAVANEHVLFTHEQAFANPAQTYAAIRAAVPGAVILEAPADRITLADAIRSYLFNSQLITLPSGHMLVVPAEVREAANVWAWLQEQIGGNNAIASVKVVDVRESMRNGGGPACLRLRVAVSEEAHAAIDPRFLLTPSRIDTISAVVAEHWPEHIAPAVLGNAALWHQCIAARHALLDAMGFAMGEL